MSIEIRPATPAERPALIELQRRAAMANPGDRDILSAHPEAIDTPEPLFEQGNVLVAEAEDGTLTGFAALLFGADGEVELDGLFVEPAHWRTGTGRALVEAAAHHALMGGADTLHVVGNPHAEAFYQRLGFRLVAVTETRFGTGLLMMRPLVSA